MGYQTNINVQGNKTTFALGIVIQSSSRPAQWPARSWVSPDLTRCRMGALDFCGMKLDVFVQSLEPSL